MQNGPRCERGPNQREKAPLMPTPKTVPQIFPDDTARTRLTDPLSSHVAADESAATVRDVADAVLQILLVVDCADGQALNILYRELRAARGWRECAYDSPRKRAGELARDGELVVLNADDPRGTPHLYALPSDDEAVAA